MNSLFVHTESNINLKASIVTVTVTCRTATEAFFLNSLLLMVQIIAIAWKRCHNTCTENLKLAKKTSSMTTAVHYLQTKLPSRVVNDKKGRNFTFRDDKIEILLKVAFSTIALTPFKVVWYSRAPVFTTVVSVVSVLLIFLFV
jgi:hypothetical protein